MLIYTNNTIKNHFILIYELLYDKLGTLWFVIIFEVGVLKH